MIPRNMEWIESSDLDKPAWDSLVSQNDGLIFNFSWYLDAVTEESWGVLFSNNERLKGIAVPYTSKINQQIVVPPFFFRASSWIGNFSEKEKEDVLNYIQSKFTGDIFTYEEKTKTSPLFYQIILPNENFQVNYHNLAKRMLKKADGNEITFGNHFDKSFFIGLVRKELGKRVQMWNTDAVENFSKLIDRLIENNSFSFIEILHNNISSGGLIVMKTDKRHIYLKGICTPEAKKTGAMYGAMHKAINFAMQNNAIFDFGGSRVDGVANFNRKLGGIDQHYKQIEWNKHPFWYKGLKEIKNKWNQIKK